MCSVALVIPWHVGRNMPGHWLTVWPGRCCTVARTMHELGTLEGTFALAKQVFPYLNFSSKKTALLKALLVALQSWAKASGGPEFFQNTKHRKEKLWILLSCELSSPPGPHGEPTHKSLQSRLRAPGRHIIRGGNRPQVCPKYSVRHFNIT